MPETLPIDGVYLAYTRKSREDRDAEAHGGEDTLARQTYIVEELAKRHNLQIAGWYQEVVSGETIADRPQMQKLLSDIETIRPDGVLVMEVERLSRGNAQDQGRVSDTFKYAESLIITPTKIYDLQKENDEEWLDFGLMMSRMEYRTIKRRLQRGRTTSAMQGKFICSTAPYGWQRKKLENEKGFTLIPDPDTAWVLKLMYEMMDIGTAETGFKPSSTSGVARALENMRIKPPQKDYWVPSVIGRILRNPANMGMQRVNYKPVVKTVTDGKVTKSRKINKDFVLVPARWDAVISPELFERVCSRIGRNSCAPPSRTIKGVLAGVVRCGECGRMMIRKTSTSNRFDYTLYCPMPKCPNVASYYSLVEQRLISQLEQTLGGYKLEISSSSTADWASEIAIKANAANALESEKEALKRQLNKVHISFEQEVYDLDTFLSRSKSIKADMSDKERMLKELRQGIADLRKREQQKTELIPHFENILDSYKASADPAFKNEMLRQLVERVEYRKSVRSDRTGKDRDKFELDVHIRFNL